MKCERKRRKMTMTPFQRDRLSGVHVQMSGFRVRPDVQQFCSLVARVPRTVGVPFNLYFSDCDSLITGIVLRLYNPFGGMSKSFISLVAGKTTPRESREPFERYRERKNSYPVFAHLSFLSVLYNVSNNTGVMSKSSWMYALSRFRCICVLFHSRWTVGRFDHNILRATTTLPRFRTNNCRSYNHPVKPPQLKITTLSSSKF